MRAKALVLAGCAMAMTMGCLEAAKAQEEGAETPAAADEKDPLADIPIRAYSTAPYQRRDWGGWRDTDKDCQNTRHEVLSRESLEDVVFVGNKRQCWVKRGKWKDPYTGATYTRPNKLDVDHMVPLRHAHGAGGYSWSRDKRRDYANSLAAPEHLIAVSSGANRSKGDKAPHQWMPPNEAYHCEYLHNWVAIKRRWKLAMSAKEARFIRAKLKRCSP